MPSPARCTWNSLGALLAPAAVVLLLACGGGGGSSNSNTPAITTPPADQNVAAGATATFTVAASGTPAPSYQWERSYDGTTWTAIATATGATYSYAAPLSDNGALFRAKASNSAGTATSASALLTVTAAGGTSAALVAGTAQAVPVATSSSTNLPLRH